MDGGVPNTKPLDGEPPKPKLLLPLVLVVASGAEPNVKPVLAEAAEEENADAVVDEDEEEEAEASAATAIVAAVEEPSSEGWLGNTLAIYCVEPLPRSETQPRPVAKHVSSLSDNDYEHKRVFII